MCLAFKAFSFQVVLLWIPCKMIRILSHRGRACVTHGAGWKLSNGSYRNICTKASRLSYKGILTLALLAHCCSNLRVASWSQHPDSGYHCCKSSQGSHLHTHMYTTTTDNALSLPQTFPLPCFWNSQKLEAEDCSYTDFLFLEKIPAY